MKVMTYNKQHFIIWTTLKELTLYAIAFQLSNVPYKHAINGFYS